LKVDSDDDNVTNNGKLFHVWAPPMMSWNAASCRRHFGHYQGLLW